MKKALVIICSTLFLVGCNSEHVHQFDVIFHKDATCDEEGYNIYKCRGCGEEKLEKLELLEAKYHINIFDKDTGEQLKIQGVPETGVYNLTSIDKRCFKFINFTDASDNVFPSSGTIFKDIDIYANYELKDPVIVSTFDELKRAVKSEEPIIVINSDIEISETLYIQDVIYLDSSGSNSIIRDKDFKGDLMVVGCDENLVPSFIYDKHPYLHIGETTINENKLIIDGNKDNLTISVTGSAISTIDSSKLYISNNVEFINHKKIGNELSYLEKFDLSHPDEVGGAAIMNISSEVNILGGKFYNNEVKIDETDDKNSSQGGVIYNYGSCNIEGGEFYNNNAARGGVIYNYRTVNINKGNFHDNNAGLYAACVYTADSQYGHIYVGNDDTILEENDLVFDNNKSAKSGGVFFSSKFPAYVIRNAKFTNNSTGASANGGVINAAGPVTIRNSYFEGNSCTSKGGCVYSYYNDDTGGTSARNVLIENCTFKNNSGKNGGAIMSISNNENRHPLIVVKNSEFLENTATGGGAIYLNGYVNCNISSSTFDGNTASGNGGAIYSYGLATLDVGVKDDKESNNTFSNNKSTSSKGYGGVAYISHSGDYLSQEIAKISNFYMFDADNNSANKGGCIYMTSGESGQMTELHIYEGATEDNVASQGSDIFSNTDRSKVYIPNYYDQELCKFKNTGEIYLTHGEVIADE